MALLASGVVVVTALALASPALAFAGGMLVVVLAVLVGTTLLVRRARARWIGRDAAAWIDRRCALDGRLQTAAELGDRGDPALHALLRAQLAAVAPRLAPQVAVPRVVPWRPLVATAVALALLAVVAATLPRRGPARVVVVAGEGGTRVAGDGAVAADEIAIAPDAASSDATGGAGDASAGDGAVDDLAAGAAALQGWLRETLGADEPWTETDPEALADASRAAAPPRARRGRRSDTGVAENGAAPADAVPAPADDGLPDARARRAALAAADAAAGGGAGPGAGDGTDPHLFGATTAARGELDRFELAIAARVRARTAGPQAAWDDAPAPEPDAGPSDVAAGAPTAPVHPAVVPPAWAGVLRRLYAHAPPETP